MAVWLVGHPQRSGRLSLSEVQRGAQLSEFPRGIAPIGPRIRTPRLTFRGYLILILVPSSPSSWCGRGGRPLVVVRRRAVDEGPPRVDSRSRFGVGSVDATVDSSTAARGASPTTRFRPRRGARLRAGRGPGCPHRPSVVHRFGPFVHSGAGANRFTTVAPRPNADRLHASGPSHERQSSVRSPPGRASRPSHIEDRPRPRRALIGVDELTNGGNFPAQLVVNR